jgi:hypothetical protein
MNGKSTMVGALRAAFGALAACLVAARALLAAALAQAAGNEHRRRGGGLGQGEAAASIPPMGVPLDTIVDRDGQRVLQVGSSFYPMPGGNAYLLVLDRKSVAGDSVAKAAFDQLPLGSSIDSALADKLKPYVSDTARYLAVLTGPTGAGNGSAILPYDKPFSYVSPIVSGIDDLKSIGQENYGGVKNVGLQLEPSGPHAIPGELFGYLQRAGVGHLFSFVRTENVPFETRTQLTTLVAPAPVAPRDGDQYLLVSALGTALDVHAGSTARGERLVANGRTGLGSQRWVLHGGPDAGGEFELENATSGLCAEVADASKEAGASVVQSPCDHGLNQRWRPIPLGDGSYLLASVSDRLVLSVQGDSAGPDTPVVQDSHRTGAKGQAWKFQPVPGSTPVAPAAHAVYVLASQAGTVLSIADASTEQRAAAVAEEESDLPAQRWALYPDPEAPQYFQLINVNSGLCLDVLDASKAKGAPVAQWPCDSGHEQANQLWQPLPQPGGGYALRNVNSGMVLTIGAGSEGSGKPVVQDADSDAPGQRWVFVPMVAEPQDYGVYVLSSPLGPAVDFAPDAPTGTQVVAADERDGPTQQWLAVPAGSATFPSSARALVNVKTGLCLTVPGSSKAENTRVDQERCFPNYDAPSQLWDARRQADGSYVLANVSSGLVLSIAGDAHGPPIVQAADTGARSQRWMFRPLARTLTMTVGADDYSRNFPLSWSGFGVLWLDAALRPLVRDAPLLPSYTNTGNQDFDRVAQENLVSLLAGFAHTPGSTVLIQSVGAPHPSTDRWGAVGRAIASLGGNEQVFDHLDGYQGYALVGCSSCESGQPEASGAPGADELAGVLSRGLDSTYRAQLADVQGSTGFGLLPLAYQEPGSWPVPATAGQQKAFAWVSQQLGLGNPNATDTKTWCYVPADWDVRAQYCTSEKWDDQRIDLARLVAPSGQGFTEADFKAVVSELDQEFEWISGVQDMISNLQRVFLSSESAAGFDLTKAATDVRNAVGGDGDVRLDVLELQAEMIDAASLFAPEGVEQAMGLVGACMSIASTVSQEPDGSQTLGEIETKASQLGTELSKRYAAAQSNLGLAFNLLVTDHAKLLTAYLQHKGGAWQFGYPLSDDMTDALSLATKRWLYTELIPTGYDQYRFWTPSGMGLDNIGCIQAHGGGADWYYPFDEMPGNGQFRPITNFDSSGRPEMAQLWGLGKGDPWNNAPDFKKPPASLVDPLFAPPSSRGLGLSKVRFFTSAPFAVKDCAGGLASNCKWRTPDAD